MHPIEYTRQRCHLTGESQEYKTKQYHFSCGYNGNEYREKKIIYNAPKGFSFHAYYGKD